MSEPPYSNDTTSYAASRRRQSIRSQLLAFLRDRGRNGSTTDEIEEGMQIAGNSIRPALLNLRKDGLVVDAGMVRETRSGRDAIVWLAVAK